MKKELALRVLKSESQEQGAERIAELYDVIGKLEAENKRLRELIKEMDDRIKHDDTCCFVHRCEDCTAYLQCAKKGKFTDKCNCWFTPLQKKIKQTLRQ